MHLHHDPQTLAFSALCITWSASKARSAWHLYQRHRRRRAGRAYLEPQLEETIGILLDHHRTEHPDA